MGTLVEESGLDMMSEIAIIEGTAEWNQTKFGGKVGDDV